MTKCELPNKLIADYIQSKQASEFQLNAISAKSSETRASLNAILEESTGYIISLNAVLAEPIESIRPSVIKLDSNEFLVSTDEGQ